MNKVSDPTKHKILDAAFEIAQKRHIHYGGYQKLMKEIALNEFGIGLTTDRENSWKNGIIKDEKKFMMFVLKYGV